MKRWSCLYRILFSSVSLYVSSCCVAFVPLLSKQHRTHPVVVVHRTKTPTRTVRRASSSTEPPTTPPTTADTIITPTNHNGELWINSHWELVYRPLMKFILHSFLLALLLISWEDVMCQYALPSRLLAKTTTTTVTKAAVKDSVSKENYKSHWGQSTVLGLGFGREDRLHLDVQDEASVNVPSYNEIMLAHRQERVPRWQKTSSNTQQSQAIHTLVECYNDLENLKQLTLDYRWTSLRQSLQQEPWTQLDTAAAALRPVDSAVGFDWASCAWRHCGALADIQEAVDELDALIGVLEPFEALFCLDIVERSVRDMLSEAPWSVAMPDDLRAWQVVPPYRSHRVFGPPNDPHNTVESQEADEAWRLDDEYVKALQEFRIDDE